MKFLFDASSVMKCLTFLWGTIGRQGGQARGDCCKRGGGLQKGRNYKAKMTLKPKLLLICKKI